MVLETIAQARVVLMPLIVLGELEAGFGLGKRARDNSLLLEQFLDEPFVVVPELNRGVASRYGQLMSDLRRAGTPIPTNDIWIAACALDAAAHLLTFDHHFAVIKGLERTVLETESD